MDDVLGSRYISQYLINHPERPPDKLLDWHFRQAVLANMKGSGEPIFGHDFPSGSDMLEEFRDGPQAAKRMEMELFSRTADRRLIVT